MSSLKIITPSFEFLGEIDDYESLIFARKWSKSNDFQMTIDSRKQNAEHLVKGNIVFLTPEKAAYILHVEKTTSGSLQVKGLSLKGWLSKRITVPPVGVAYDRLDDDAETIMKTYVDRNVVNPLDPDRIIPNLEIAPNQNRGLSFIFQTRFKPLDEELEKLSLSSGLGWDIRLDLSAKKFIFDVREGWDLSSQQSISPPVFFSIDFDNIESQTFVDSELGHKNAAFVGGQGEGVAREIVQIGAISGLERNEVFIDARDIEDGLDLPSRGEQKLSEYKPVQSFETTVLPYSTFIYEQDWDLGDIVTTQNKEWGITAHLRVTEITETYEPGGFRLDVVFGKSLPTLVEKIKQEIDQPVAENVIGNEGTSGSDGSGLDYSWQGTSLGIKRDDEITYIYTDLKGPVGAQGIQGMQGIQGIKGDTGSTGSQGPIGNTGLTGATGSQGLKGDTGLTGSQGPIGNAGATGPQGIQGVKGDKGDKGDLGNTGFTGPQGPAGDGNSYVKFEEKFKATAGQTVFTWNSGYVYPIGINAVSIFLNGDRQPNEAFTETSENTITLKNAVDVDDYVLIEGHQSAVDLQGPQGIQGIQGVKGDTGLTGSQGIQGISGKTWFTGTTVPATGLGVVGDLHLNTTTWNISEKTTASVWTIRGNIEGDIGPTGMQGPQGEMGPPGSSQSYVLFEKEYTSTEGQTSFSWTDGVSYPVGIKAVNLFTNGDRQPQTSFTEHANGKGITLSQGLTSGEYVLISAQMAVVDIQGPQGIQGVKGDTGSQGPIGLTGAQGTQGIQGVKGDTGLTGSQGIQGPIGNTGVQGPIGNTGSQGIQGVKGVDGKTWYSGTSVPVSGLGVLGDFHLNTSTWELREKTSSTVWTVIGNIKGAQGVQGIQGVTGTQGPIGNTGPTGPQGIQGVKGDTGETGATGPTGPQGIQGVKGDTGETGPAGAAVADSVEWVNVLNKPTSMPANGGNSDTVDGLHANDFVKVIGSERQVTNYNGLSTYENVGHYYSGNSSPVGTLCVNLGNIGNVMLDAEISIQSYTGVTKYHIRGYTYTGSLNWHMPNVTCVGSGLNHPVRFAKNASGERIILIGLTNTSWGGYLHATIPRLTIGYGANNTSPNWGVSLLTSETGIVIGSTPEMNDGLNADLLDGKHANEFLPSNYTPYHKGTTAPADTNLIWIDTN